MFPLFCPGAAPSDLQDDAVPHRGKKEVAIRSYPFGSGPIQRPTPKLCPGKQELTLLPFSTMGPAQPWASFSLFSGDIGPHLPALNLLEIGPWLYPWKPKLAS